jgi:hypothetical protein
MKLKLYFQICLFCILGYGTSFSQTKIQNNSEIIIGTWQLDPVQTMGKVKNSDKIVYNSKDEKTKRSIDKSLQSRQYLFYRDGSFKAVWAIGDQLNSTVGKWEVDGYILNILIGTVTNTYTINRISKTELELIPESKERGMIQALIFKRQK